MNKYKKILIVYAALLIQLEFIGKFLGLPGGIALMYMVLIMASAYFVQHNSTYYYALTHGYIKVILLCFAGIFFMGIISLLWSRAPLYGAYKFSMFFFKLLAMLLVAPIIKEHAKLFLKAFIIISILIIIAFVIKHNNPFQLALEMGTNNRFGLDQDTNIEKANPIIIARYFGMVSLVFLFYTFHANRIYLNMLNILFFFIAVFYLFLTGSKGPVFFLIVPLMIIFILSLRKLNRIIYFLIPLLMITTMLCLNDTVISFVRDFTESGFFQKRFLDYDYGSASDRMALYEMAVHGVTEGVPILFLLGHGVGDFGFYSFNADYSAYPHNILLEFLYELGLIGFSLLCCIILVMLKSYWKNRSFMDGYCGIWGILSVYFLLNSLVTGDMAVNMPTFGFFVLYIVCSSSRLSQLMPYHMKDQA